MNNLFCTPEQGARLKELLPELKSEFLWVMLINHETHLTFWHLSKTADYTHDRQNLTSHPALTLQELIHIAIDKGFYLEGYQIDNYIWIIPYLIISRKESAPYFAEQIIKVIEHQNKKEVQP
jgi:hypothetical protein